MKGLVFFCWEGGGVDCFVMGLKYIGVVAVFVVSIWENNYLGAQWFKLFEKNWLSYKWSDNEVPRDFEKKTNPVLSEFEIPV